MEHVRVSQARWLRTTVAASAVVAVVAVMLFAGCSGDDNGEFACAKLLTVVIRGSQIVPANDGHVMSSVNTQV